MNNYLRLPRDKVEAMDTSPTDKQWLLVISSTYSEWKIGLGASHGT